MPVHNSDIADMLNRAADLLEMDGAPEGALCRCTNQGISPRDHRICGERNGSGK